MKPYDDISMLVDRFLNGETSLAEERRLNEFFMSHESELGEMSEHLQIAAELFRELRAMNGETIPSNGNTQVRKNKPFVRQWMKWAVSIAAACLVLCIVLFSPNDTSTRSEEKLPQVAEIPIVTKSDSADTLQTGIKQIDDKIVEVPKYKPIKRQTKPVVSNPEQEEIASSTEPHEIHYEQTVQNGNVMLCGFNPNANMLPMHTDVTTRSVISECEMAILEEEFQKSERKRHTIEI